MHTSSIVQESFENSHDLTAEVLVDSVGCAPDSKRVLLYNLRPSLTNRTEDDLQRCTKSILKPSRANPATCRPSPNFSHVPHRIVGPKCKVIHVRQQESANWFTPSGVAKKRHEIEKKGMPELKGRRFITLTLDPDLFGDCPLTGYFAGKDRLRRFLAEGRLAGLWAETAWWCWKMEFSKIGWTHWHFMIDRTDKFSEAELKKISKIWGLGRTNVEMISSNHFGYTFKYVFKGVYMHEDENDSSGRSEYCVPQWFLNYYEPSVDGSKPKSFARCRFWQTSKGFYDSTTPVNVSSIADTFSSHVPFPVFDVINYRHSRFVTIARDPYGAYISSKSLHITTSWDVFARHHLFDVHHSAACTFSSSSFAMAPQTLLKLINTNEKWKLTNLLDQNYLTLNHSLIIQHNQQDLRRC